MQEVGFRMEVLDGLGLRHLGLGSSMGRKARSDVSDPSY